MDAKGEIRSRDFVKEGKAEVLQERAGRFFRQEVTFVLDRSTARVLEGVLGPREGLRRAVGKAGNDFESGVPAPSNMRRQARGEARSDQSILK